MLYTSIVDWAKKPGSPHILPVFLTEDQETTEHNVCANHQL